MKKSMTGYELKKFFPLSFSFFSGISYGSIYPALKKMKGEGLITMTPLIQDGAPNRKVYSITNKGKKLFGEALKEPVRLEPKRDSFLTQLFFFAHLSRAERIEKAKSHLSSIKEVQAALESTGPDIAKRADQYQVLCYRYGLRFYRDLVKNIEEIVGALEETSTHGGRKG
jgi:DNA-binding PadR family transcriptional regulator